MIEKYTEKLKELADKWKNNITKSTYNALYNYTVDMNN